MLQNSQFLSIWVYRFGKGFIQCHQQSIVFVDNGHCGIKIFYQRFSSEREISMENFETKC